MDSNPWATDSEDIGSARPWDTHDSLNIWGTPVPDTQWQSSYESIRFGQSESEQEQPEESEQEEQPKHEPEQEQSEEQPKDEPEQDEEPAAQVDAFGTFESGLDDEQELDPWTPARPEHSEPEDEWEAAKRQKQIQDQLVPPEVLESILAELDQVSRDFWPQDTSDEQSAHWRDGIEEIASLAEQVIPQLTLPPIPPFNKSAVSKRVADSVRLTRNVHITRMGPMSKYLATKGSTAWEASVKARPEVLPDAVLPAGWRIVEKKEEIPATPVESKKKTGILSSFFSRRASTPPVADSKPNSPRNSISSPRPSMDNKPSSPVASPTTSTPPIVAPVLSAVASSSSSSSSTTTAATSTESPDLFPEPPPPPSAVSRFLNRFSRAKSSSPHTSLALSSDDLDLLGDIVPSASDDEPPESDPHLKGLANMIASAPISDKLPPPLAPPPKPVPLPKPPTPSILSPTQVSKPPLDTAVLTPTSTSSSPLSGSTPTEKKMNAFIFPPPPKSTTARKTPVAIMSNGGASSSSASSSFSFLPPPPSAPARTSPSASGSSTPTPSMLSFDDNININNDSSANDDDDEFSDFHSYSYASPPPTSRPLQNVQDSPSSTTSYSSSSISSTSVHQGLFSDHQSHQSQSSLQWQQSPPARGRGRGGFGYGGQRQGHGHEYSTNSIDLLKDDFDDFVSGGRQSPTPAPKTLQTPSPPKPLAKSPGKLPPLPPLPPPFGSSQTRTQLPPSSAPIPTSISSPVIPTPPAHVLAAKQKKQEQEHLRQLAHDRKPSREAEHQRTRSLMENAAARDQKVSQWPAPRSPLPPILSPPPESGGPKDEIDLFGAFNEGSVTPTRAQMQMGTLTSSISSPAAFNLQPPPVRKGTLPPIPASPAPTTATATNTDTFDFGVLQPLPPPPSSPGFGSMLQAQKVVSASGSGPGSRSTTPAMGLGTGTAKSGGLSAQDLSFFEGL
ncbi:hypothetical protein VKT23_014812 [Stygiomarasmius scandens]|uniref:Uncharacterized protein n=1 Tax=Marasmiellus scandens TaxID=2682957 RepID=A0ABR1IZD6_9AGAR